MNDEIKMSHDIAAMIVHMEDVCYGEGIGPDNNILMSWIKETYPDLVEKYSYLSCWET